MKYIKLILWFLIVSIVYASGVLKVMGISPELLLVFSILYSFMFGKLKSTITVSIISGVLTSVFGGRNFVFCILMCVIFSLLVYGRSNIRHKLRFIISLSFVFVFVYELIYYGLFCVNSVDLFYATVRIIIPSTLYSVLSSLVMYPIIKKTFSEKEHYIFN